MPSDARSRDTPPLTPCTGICRLDRAGYCIGCRRSMDEIVRWRDMSDAERRHCMHEVLPSRGDAP
jgi:predicted Fe-S protein YdhL (DUF1289 family)